MPWGLQRGQPDGQNVGQFKRVEADNANVAGHCQTAFLTGHQTTEGHAVIEVIDDVRLVIAQQFQRALKTGCEGVVQRRARGDDLR